MKERPILFSGPMVRAILEGRKTQTRLVVKPLSGPHTVEQAISTPDSLAALIRHFCPYGQPGDRLWVRERTHIRYLPHLLTGDPTSAECGAYSADNKPVITHDGLDVAWWYSRKICPCNHMPRNVCRITLEITAVRAERLQDISEADALAEGVEVLSECMEHGSDCAETSAQSQYHVLWSSINGPDSWAANPWVWVIEFKRVEGGAQ